MVQAIDLWNYESGIWEEVDTRNASRFSDATVTVSATGDCSRFVESGARSILTRCRFQSVNPRQRFSANIDQTIWEIVE